MCSAFYDNNIKDFLNQKEDEIFGIIAKNDEYDSVCKQKDAWIAQIRLLKNVLKKYSNGSVIFEYTIPRVGGRIDNVVLLNDGEVTSDTEITERYMSEGYHTYDITENSTIENSAYVNILEGKFIRVYTELTDTGVLKIKDQDGNTSKEYFEI